MKESALWRHLKPELAAWGKFQKISDRFTPGIPDVLGASFGHPMAIELKELEGVRVIRTKFRPGQLDWLEDWDKAGGYSMVLSTWGKRVYIHPWEAGTRLELGVSPEELDQLAVLVFVKTPRNSWGGLVTQLMEAL